MSNLSESLGLPPDLTGQEGVAARLRRRREGLVPEGTVVRFVSVSAANDQLRYHYAAIYAGGQWYVTGRTGYFGQQVLATDDLIALLAKRLVIEVEVATVWEEI